jgi:tRNA dimethylallyltransferase
MPICRSSPPPSPADLAEVPHRLYGAWDGAELAPPPIGPRARDEMRQPMPRRCRSWWGARGFISARCWTASRRCPAFDPIREAVRAMPVAEAHAALTLEDPERAALLNRADTTRRARAGGGALPGTLWPGGSKAGRRDRRQVTLAPLVLLPDRAWLYALRSALCPMVEAGALEKWRRCWRAAGPGPAGDARDRVAEMPPTCAAILAGRRLPQARRPRGAMPSGNLLAAPPAPPDWPRHAVLKISTAKTF